MDTVQRIHQVGSWEVLRQHLIQKKRRFFTFLLVGKDGVPESPWKPHKSKEDKFLHRNYIPKKFSTPKKNLRSRKKIFLENLNFEIFQNPKNFQGKSYDFSWFVIENFPDFENFNNKKTENFSTSKLFFFGVEKKLGYSFDAEICPLSIYEVFRTIPALQPCQPAKMLKNHHFFVKYVDFGPPAGPARQIPRWPARERFLSVFWSRKFRVQTEKVFVFSRPVIFLHNFLV